MSDDVIELSPEDILEMLPPLEEEAPPAEESALEMVEPDEEVLQMVEAPTPGNRVTSERVAQRMAGQTHAKFRQVRAEAPVTKRKYLGKARRY